MGWDAGLGCKPGNSLLVQWLAHSTLTANGSIPVREPDPKEMRFGKKKLVHSCSFTDCFVGTLNLFSLSQLKGTCVYVCDV